jgi:hypothetical protein
MMDDDVTFQRVRNRRCVNCLASEALAVAEDAMDDTGVDLVSFEFRHRAWCADGKPVRNGNATSAYLVRTTASANFLPKLRLREDLDFVLQLIAHGKGSLRLTTYSFSAPKMGSKPGGCQAAYTQAKLDAGFKNMQMLMERWPWCMTPIPPEQNDGYGWGLKVDWKAVKNAQG